jgi:hypothetical protein
VTASVLLTTDSFGEVCINPTQHGNDNENSKSKHQGCY